MIKITRPNFRNTYLVNICPNSHEKSDQKLNSVEVGSNITQNLSSSL